MERSNAMMDNRFVNKVICWYQMNARQLPWRERKDPYGVLVSEVMLQQTQVNTVIPYYLRFMEALPQLKDLAFAPQEKLHSLWQGLGYYSRVERLQQFAIAVLEQYDGIIPNTKEKLIQLPGIGPYTCGAVLSFCFNVKIPAIDGNVKRVLARLWNDSSDITKTTTSKKFIQQLEKILPDNIYPFNQGMIELGALICKPKNPLCQECPVKVYCQAYEKGTVSVLPNKPKKVKQKKMNVPLMVIEEDDEILFVKRSSKGILANLWGLPIVEENLSEDKHRGELKAYFEENFDIIDIWTYALKESIREAYIKHVFSHVIWDQHIIYIKVTGLKNRLKNHEFPEINWAKPHNVPIPTAFVKSLKSIGIRLGKNMDEREAQ